MLTTAIGLGVETLTQEDVLLIRKRLANTDLAGRDFGGEKPLSESLLSSAVSRQHTGFGNARKYTEVEDVGATLFYELVTNRAFENGNKRTALVSLFVFLENNGILLVETDEDDLYDLATSVAGHTLLNDDPEPANDVDVEVEAIADYLRARVRPRVRGERALRFRDLRKILTDLGCTISAPSKSFVRITPPAGGAGRVTKMAYGGEGREVSMQYVHKIRKQLGLAETSGIDSAAFYDFDSKVDYFVNTYRAVLDRLSDA